MPGPESREMLDNSPLLKVQACVERAFPGLGTAALGG